MIKMRSDGSTVELDYNRVSFLGQSINLAGLELPRY